jgi:hypothetical protein
MKDFVLFSCLGGGCDTTCTSSQYPCVFTMKNNSSDLQQIILITRKMLEQAQSASWDEVSKLEAERRSLLHMFFMFPILDELVGTVSEGIRSITAIDENIMELGRAEKHELEQVLRQIDQGKKAIKAYDS